jgi:hypothetical protein
MKDDTQAKHHITRETSGDQFASYIQPVCTCGWKGRKQSCHNNWQMHDVARAITDHLYSETRNK